MPGKISVHRLLGYHVSLITQGYMSFLMDAILFVFLLLVVKPAMLVLIYGELFLMLIWFIASTILIELYEIIPLILLCTYLFYPNSLMTCRLSGLVVLEKLLLMGPSRYHNFQGVLEYFQHVVSPSLMMKFFSLPMNWSFRKTKEESLAKASVVYRFFKHAL